ncbi:hypothetical protein XabCFBP2524_04130 [Xanthomonas axonopodis pv. begoniae]|nr:hypothetical protein XabCFBP2524_04130 [Xanthomonas axonopodis pv. begoniae]
MGVVHTYSLQRASKLGAGLGANGAIGRKKISEPGSRCDLACTCLVKSRLGDRQSSSLACGACNVAGAPG